MNNFVRLGFLPRGYDLALLVLRLWTGAGLFLRHGLNKAAGFSRMAGRFPDPIHIGSRRTLAFAVLSDAVCSLLLILGLGTRWAALVIAINTSAAFVLVHKFQLMGDGSGEFAWVYFGAALTLFIAGGGRFSVDGPG
jgi:putative oxidoreductase